MTDLIKGVLGGGWALVLGWLFPAGISVAGFLLLVLPSINDGEPSTSLDGASSTTTSLLVLGSTAALGILLSAMQTPLYRVLEGYLLWPTWVAERRRRRHVARRAALTTAVGSAHGYRAGLAEERRRRYPDEEKDVVPTALGNAIRRFEVYGWNTYQLNTQTLWYRILAVVPESASRAVEYARANVDFFVCLLYSQLLVAISAALALFTGHSDTLRLSIALGLGALIALISYRMAIVATDEWAASVRALADLSRVPLAEALGLRLPQSLEDERQMWRALYWLDRAGYSPEASEFLSLYRRPD